MTRLELWNSVNTEATLNYFVQLKERWDDEKEYENIESYLNAIKKNCIPQAYKILQKPFSIVARCDDGEVQIGIMSQQGYYKSFAKTYKH